MKQKQEVWRWVRHGDKSAPSVAGASEVGCNCWPVPFIGGIDLLPCGKFTLDTLENNMRLASIEIRRQLAAHGIRCEIRRVKR